MSSNKFINLAVKKFNSQPLKKESLIKKLCDNEDFFVALFAGLFIGTCMLLVIQCVYNLATH